MSATEHRRTVLLHRALRSEDAFTLIELMVAVFILIVGILGMWLAFETSQRLSLVSERHAAMAHMAQKEIERLEGIQYSQIGLTSAPSSSTDPANPDYYVVAGSPPMFEWDRSTGSKETLDVDSATGQITHVQPWTEGQLSGQIYDFVTWSADSRCAPGCPSSQNYKRVTVAVTMGGGVQPRPVFVSSVVADPQALPTGGISNGTGGNPLANPATSCIDAHGNIVSCTSPIDSGNPNTYFLHDWPATNTGTPQPPSADHATHPTLGATTGLQCTTSTLLAQILSNITGCPVPDLMDSGPPGGSSSSPPPLYHYSTDQCADSCYPGGRLLQPLCSTGLCSGSSGGGSDSAGDCSGGSWLSNFLNVQGEFWVTSPVTATTTLTGDGGLSMYTQTLNNASVLVSFCIEIYDVPPSGAAGSLGDILAWPPVALGGAAYVPESDPVTGGNWPTSASQASFIFNFRGSSGSVSIAPGHRLGVRLWMKANVNQPIDLIYDNPLYPAQVQLNTQ